MTKPAEQTYPCSGGCGTPVTTIWDGKMHYCEACHQQAYDNAVKYWAEVGVDLPRLAARR
jgi:hypothetical protein